MAGWWLHGCSLYLPGTAVGLGPSELQPTGAEAQAAWPWATAVQLRARRYQLYSRAVLCILYHRACGLLGELAVDRIVIDRKVPRGKCS